MSLCLTRDELAELSGCKRRGNTVRWLVKSGYKYEIAADGWPRILREAVDVRLMPSLPRQRAVFPQSQPDWAGLDAIGRRNKKKK